MGHLFIYILKSIITLAAAKDFFRYYEKLNFVSHQEFLRVRHNIWQKQNPLHSTDKLTTAWIRMQGQKSIQVFLKAFETEWNIFARYDEDFCNDDAVVETHSPTGNIITRNFQDLGIVAFKGIVRNSPSTPKFVGTVKGSVQGGIFQGHIALYNDSLYIEPAKKFCIENCWYNAIIYRASDVMFSNFLVRRCQGHGEIGCVQDYMENEVYAPKKDMGLSNSSSNNNGFETDLQTVFTDPNRPRTCMVWSVADDLFAKAYGGTSGAVQQMKVYLEAADHIYRETDFNRDNRPDQVGMKAIRYKVYEKANHPMAKEGQASERILSTFASLVTKDYCLGILFTRNRWTPSGRIGLAYTAEAYSKTRIGGMCASNLNALIVTEMDSQYQILPDLVNALTTAHEFGHSFGTRHDSMSNPQCFPGKYSPDGNYIMSPTADDGHRENNVKFSTCSLDQINPVIQANGMWTV